MKSFRLAAGVLYACGLLSLLMGWEGSGLAECTEQLYQSAHCLNAYAEGPKKNGSQSYCEWEMNECGLAAESACVDKWGSAYPGECQWDPLGSIEIFDCYEDSFTTFVNVFWYLARCEPDNGNCECVWEASSTFQPAQLCDCYDVQIQ